MKFFQSIGWLAASALALHEQSTWEPSKRATLCGPASLVRTGDYNVQNKGADGRTKVGRQPRKMSDQLAADLGCSEGVFVTNVSADQRMMELG